MRHAILRCCLLASALLAATLAGFLIGISEAHAQAAAAAPPTQMITPGQGSLTDCSGNVWTISASGSVMEGNTDTPGGGGTSQLAIVNCTIYGEDASGKGWFTLSSDGQWNASAAPPTGGGSGTKKPDGGSAAMITPGQGALTDCSGNVWTINASGQIMEGDNDTPGGGGTSHLAIVNCTIYGEDASGRGWFTLSSNGQWISSAAPPTSGSTPPPTCAGSSAGGTTDPSAASLTDCFGDVWNLSGGQPQINQNPAGGILTNATLLLFYNGNMYYEDSSHNWYLWSTQNTGWVPVSGDPRAAGGRATPSSTAYAAQRAARYWPPRPPPTSAPPAPPPP